MLITQGDILIYLMILPLVFVPPEWPTEVATPSIKQNSVQDASQALMNYVQHAIMADLSQSLSSP
ncbi:hypothetical protein BS17DRAFT_783201 [Gyrodon lividus]|nr:hypothetical protein BS17DRAFT_783201 [Gyrodon lividus]